MKRIMAVFHSFLLILVLLVFPVFTWSKPAEIEDAVCLNSGQVLEGCITLETRESVNIENVGGTISVTRQAIRKVIHSSPGESELILGKKLLQRNKLDRAQYFLQQAAQYSAWRAESEEALQQIQDLYDQKEQQRLAQEQAEIERMIQRQGLQAGIDELARRYKDENEYWGSLRGKFHLALARDRINHLDLTRAEHHLLLAEKYGVDPEEWKKAQQELLSMRKQSLLKGSSALAQHQYQKKASPKMIDLRATQFLKVIQTAHARGEKIPPLEFLELVDQYAKENNLDPFLVWALIDTESAWDKNAVSSKGAQGLMQLMPMTAKDLEVRNPFDPEENIKGGTQYMNFLIQMFKDIDTALAAYNVGPGRIEREGIPPAGKRYVEKVRSRFNNLQQRFGIASRG